MHSILERESSVGTSRENTYSKPEINSLQASMLGYADAQRTKCIKELYKYD